MDVSGLITRAVSYSLAFFLVSLLSTQSVLTLFIFMGQAHFILSYWYKYERIPHIWKTPLFAIWITSLVLLFSASYFEYISYNVLIAITALLFVTHFIVDEVLLTKSGVSLTQSLGLFSGVFSVFVLEIIQLIFDTQYSETTLILCAVLTFLATFTLILRTSTLLKMQYFAYYSLFVACVSSFIILGTNAVSLAHSLGFIILSHYFIWYGHYFLKLKENTVWHKTYIRRVVGVNLFVLSIFIYIQFDTSTPFLDYFFSETFFYVWTCLHIITSLLPRSFNLPYAETSFLKR